jgi:hypothetical protein
VLRQAELLAPPAKGIEGRWIELAWREHVRILEPVLHRLDRVLRGELPVEAVVDQEQVGRRTGRDGRGEARDQIVAVARLDELHVLSVVLLLVRVDHLAVGGELLRVTEDEEPHGPAVLLTAATGQRDDENEREQGDHDPNHEASLGECRNHRCTTRKTTTTGIVASTAPASSSG